MDIKDINVRLKYQEVCNYIDIYQKKVRNYTGPYKSKFFKSYLVIDGVEQGQIDGDYLIDRLNKRLILRYSQRYQKYGMRYRDYIIVQYSDIKYQTQQILSKMKMFVKK